MTTNEQEEGQQQDAHTNQLRRIPPSGAVTTILTASSETTTDNTRNDTNNNSITPTRGRRRRTRSRPQQQQQQQYMHSPIQVLQHQQSSSSSTRTPTTNHLSTEETDINRTNHSNERNDDYDDDSVYRFHGNNSHHHDNYNNPNGSNNNSEDALQRVTRVSRHAVHRTKEVVWDSNELSIEAALNAVDQWECCYNAVRQVTVKSVHSAATLYGAAKGSAGKLEHGLLRPLRDWILLPAFTVVERVTAESIQFLGSPQATAVAQQTLQVAGTVPVVGPNLLAPGLLLSAVAVQRTWHVLQYPIPSKEQVRHTVDAALTGTKWALAGAARSIRLYVQRADANITRTLSHTQWKVLGSGPYATLSAVNKAVVLDHLVERYLCLPTLQARYELAAHCRWHNPALYADLVATGLLLERGGDLVQDDEWLRAQPVYRDAALWAAQEGQQPDADAPAPFLLWRHPLQDDDDDDDDDDHDRHYHYYSSRIRDTPSALWFRQLSVNGKPPARDAPWLVFRRQEQRALEQRYQEIVRQGRLDVVQEDDSGVLWVEEEEEALRYSPLRVGAMRTNNSSSSDDELNDSIFLGEEEEIMNMNQQQQQHEELPPLPEEPPTPRRLNRTEEPTFMEEPEERPQRKPPPTIAQWYTPTRDDVLVDQQRLAVSFLPACPKCRQRLDKKSQSAADITTSYGQECDSCRNGTSDSNDSSRSDTVRRHQTMPFGPPPLTMLCRPCFWRFYGPGDEVRRATWFLDTPRHGLQPFDDEAHAVLEDAYLFLKWMAYRESVDPELLAKKELQGESVEESLLTVEVPCPDGTARLVQFSSLTQATAIQKGLGAAIAVFKRRVYRGAWLMMTANSSNDDDGSTSGELTVTGDVPLPPTSPTVDETIAQAVQENGSLGETIVPDVSIRSLLEPPLSPQPRMSGEVDLLPLAVDFDASLAAPPERLANDDMAKHLRDEKESKIDHLCLIVHGIGEMLRSIDVFGMSLQNLADACGSMRSNHAQVQDAHFARMYPTANASFRASTGRVEYLPVEWHESFSILTQRRAPLDESSLSQGDGKSQVMIQDISLRTIPNMREFANDTPMDVLFFMSPEHHDIIIDVVTHEMNLVVEKFRRTTGFNGSISLIGHSLGSIISWDILNNQNVTLPNTSALFDNVPSYESLRSGRQPSSQQSENSDTPELTTPTTSASSQNVPENRSSYPQLNFVVDNFFLLGSPLPVFLMIRNQRMPLSEDFYLRGCRRVFNIFHPYDPVAYRIEPCISPRNSDFEPTIVKHWNGGFRVQYRTRRLWRKLMETTAMTQRNVVEAFEQSMAGMGLLDATVDAGGEDDENEEDDLFNDEAASVISGRRTNHSSLMTGQLNQGRRIDYMLQEKEIENANEYVAALAAHSSYWIEKDLSLFIARQIYLSTLEHSAAEAEATEQSNWEALTPEDPLYSK